MAARQRLTTGLENYWCNTGHTKEDANKVPIFSFKHISMFGLALLLQNLIFKIELKNEGQEHPKTLKAYFMFLKKCAK